MAGQNGDRPDVAAVVGGAVAQLIPLEGVRVQTVTTNNSDAPRGLLIGPLSLLLPLTDAAARAVVQGLTGVVLPSGPLSTTAPDG